jgi:DNA-binding NarL/FixJ family response regulator
MPAASPTTVLIADDHAGFRAALESLLAAVDDFVLVGSARDGAEAVALAERLRPRVVIMDLTMPRLNGVEATRLIRRRLGSTNVIALSGSRELMRDAVAAGAMFTALKEDDPQELLALIRSAAAG